MFFKSITPILMDLLESNSFLDSFIRFLRFPGDRNCKDIKPTPQTLKSLLMKNYSFLSFYVFLPLNSERSSPRHIYNFNSHFLLSRQFVRFSWRKDHVKIEIFLKKRENDEILPNFWTSISTCLQIMLKTSTFKRFWWQLKNFIPKTPLIYLLTIWMNAKNYNSHLNTKKTLINNSFEMVNEVKNKFQVPL